MKRALGVAAFCLAFAPATAVDVGADFVMTNFGFPWAQESPVADGQVPDPLDFLYGGGGRVSQRLSDVLTISTSYRLDPLSRSWLGARAEYSAGVVQLGLGTQFGLFNNLDRPLTAGLSSSIEIELPGIIFASVAYASSLGQSLVAVGDNSQERNEVSLGWYVRNAICTASIVTEEYQERIGADLATTDTLVDYQFLVDVFKKNQPYNVLLSLGYRTVSREYASAGLAVKDSLGAFVLGTGFKLRPAPWIEISAMLDSGLYAFGFDDLLGQSPARSSYFFKANAGVTDRTEEFRPRGKPLPKVEKPEEGDAAEGTGTEEGKDAKDTGKP